MFILACVVKLELEVELKPSKSIGFWIGTVLCKGFWVCCWVAAILFSIKPEAGFVFKGVLPIGSL